METRFGRFTLMVAALLLSTLGLYGQTMDVEVDYNNPKEYVIGGVRVEGNSYYTDEVILSVCGLTVGNKITIPGEDVSNIVRKMWAQKYFDNVAIDIDRVSEKGDSVYLCLNLREKPRLSYIEFTGVKSGEKKELLERLHLRRGSFFTDYEDVVSRDIIKRFYAEKGFINCKVDTLSLIHISEPTRPY